ncbi:MAG: hypothetical protein AB7O52_10450 [Planctomycetota bacterium]
MKKSLGFLAVALSLTTGSLSAQDDRYQLRAGSAMAAPGASAAVSITLDSVPGTAGAPADLQGWSYGLCHDSALLSVTSVVNGSTSATVNGGGVPDFNAINIMPNPGAGFTIGVVIDFFGVERLAPGSGYELNIANYNTLYGAGGSASLNFCNTLATPPVETLVVVAGGASAIPVQNSGLVEDGTPPALFTLTAGTAQDIAGATVSLPVSLDNPLAAEGFSFGILHDSAVASVTGGTQGAVTQGSNGGSGADFFFVNTTPVLPVGATGGAFVGCVVSLSPPFDVIAMGVGQEIVVLSYQIGAATTAGQSTSVDFSGDVGNPPVAIVVSVNGGSQAVNTLVSGSITSDGVVAGQTFRRGDANDDGIVDVSDVVFLAKWLFGVGPASTCDDAGDANDNGVLDSLMDPLYLLTYLFQAGPAPAAPFANCGLDPTADALDCLGPLNSCP